MLCSARFQFVDVCDDWFGARTLPDLGVHGPDQSSDLVGTVVGAGPFLVSALRFSGDQIPDPVSYGVSYRSSPQVVPGFTAYGTVTEVFASEFVSLSQAVLCLVGKLGMTGAAGLFVRRRSVAKIGGDTCFSAVG